LRFLLGGGWKKIKWQISRGEEKKIAEAAAYTTQALGNHLAWVAYEL
jgi:hypothetical protein